jgi:hypothetical protein
LLPKVSIASNHFFFAEFFYPLSFLGTKIANSMGGWMHTWKLIASSGEAFTDSKGKKRCTVIYILGNLME